MYIPAHRNPLVQGTLNPMVNGAINPSVNGSLNPLVNGSRNPLVNGSINPLVNGSINPLVNGAINYMVNGSINPLVNGSLNPLVNGSVNPLVNGSYSGPYFFDTKGTATGFGVSAGNGVLVLFGEDLRHAGTGVPTGDMLILFDTHNKWIGYFVPNGAGGYARFNSKGQWVGYGH